jgi:hypothetical protein
MKVVKLEPQAVLIQDQDIEAWVDVWIEEEDVQCDWNQYIFLDSDPNDMAIKTWQENPDNFDMASSLAVEALEKAGIIRQAENGKWYNAED